MSTTFQMVLQHVDEFVVGLMSIQELHDWVTRATWERTVEENARGMLADVELILAEYTSRHRSIDEVRECLAAMARRIRTEVEYIQASLDARPLRQTTSLTALPLVLAYQ